MVAPLVEFRSVEKRFGDFVAVERVNFTIEAGEFVAIMGPSGCGKTTTLRMLAGLEAPSEGEVLMEGRVMNYVPAHERDTPLVWQSLALFPCLTARENVEFGLQMRGVSAPERRRRAPTGAPGRPGHRQRSPRLGERPPRAARRCPATACSRAASERRR